jgi:uncharacterized protein YdaU (DUF1376 family)
MKGEFYKMDFRAWNVGTVDLTLEQEAAYLRLCHAMYDVGGPVPNSTRMLMGLFRCGNTKAITLLNGLIAAGKIAVTSDDRLINHRVTEELASRERVSSARRIAGERGGSAPRATAERLPSDPRPTAERPSTDLRPTSSKPLKNNTSDEAIASTPGSRGEEIREEKNSLRSLERVRAHEWPPDYREQAWELYGKKVDKPESMAALDKLHRADTVSWSVLSDGFRRQAVAVPNPKFRPSLERYLKRGKWTDEAPLEEPAHGPGSSDRIAKFSARRGPARPVVSVVGSAMARFTDQGGLGSREGPDYSGRQDRRDPRSGGDDPEIPDADWSPAGRYSAAH